MHHTQKGELSLKLCGSQGLSRYWRWGWGPPFQQLMWGKRNNHYIDTLVEGRTRCCGRDMSLGVKDGFTEKGTLKDK